MYRDDDIMKELESKIQGMTLDDKPIKDGRVFKKAARKTDKGKESSAHADKLREKNKMLLKANLKDKKTD